MKNPEYWMQLALEQAQLAESQGEVPVGAIIVFNNELVASGRNCPIGTHDASMHAEIAVIREAGKILQNYRLTGCELYVTLEPCMMCLGAMLHARIGKLYYGASDPKTGAVGGLVDLQAHYKVNHSLEIYSNVLAEHCGNLLKNFFKNKRN